MKVLFLDLETTGLDWERDTILEFAWILYDIVEERDIGRYQCVLFGKEARFLPMQKIVQEMHTKSGLFADCDRAQDDGLVQDATAAEMDTLEFLHAQGIGRGELILSGFTPHFDRNFLAGTMASLDAYLHYRHLDISSLRTLEKAWNGSNPEKVDKHRALPDYEEAIAELLRFKRKWPGAAPLVTPMMVQP